MIVRDRRKGRPTNPLLVPDRGPRQRLLFLGPWSYKLEDFGTNRRGRHNVSVGERGHGRRSEIVLFRAEIRWLVGRLRQAKASGDCGLFLGRVSGGGRSVASWLRSEEGGRVLQVVLLLGQRHQQMFIPSMDGV
ncbi:hypothetical protein LOK49_LG09G01306 [Camellia lanceoleosa]|uniref:Uncharacterized protein n=1 Tax=Camellia lanceoleosa TaxID=1840588 RepID=A0ACC0GLJ2_9ERIC|nr:hypothetical protein LOK49_LG09G01306 [Camellia lanceoleosa]